MQVEKFHWKTEEAFNRIRKSKPVVLVDCPLVCPAHVNWTMEGVSSMINHDFQCDVFVGSSKRFQYFDGAKNSYQYEFTSPTRKIGMTFPDFLRALKRQDKPSSGTQYHYLQQSLVAEMGQRILEEYSKFSLQTAALYKVLAGWNELTHNLLLCGKEGYITPLHFDEQENIFTQLTGRKRVRLMPPDAWHMLYPYPCGHPCDRQCQVVLPPEPGSITQTDEERFKFPCFAEAGGQELYVDLLPGEVLYIPQYWFHQMEGLEDNVSLSWWFKHITKRDNVDIQSINLEEVCLVAVRRNIESLVSNMVGSGKRAHNFFLALASGRVKIPGIEYKTAPSSSSSGGSKPTAAVVAVGGETKPFYVTLDLIVADTDAGALKLSDIEDEQWNVFVMRALSVLSMIFKPELAPGVLLQVVSGRFHSV